MKKNKKQMLALAVCAALLVLTVVGVFSFVYGKNSNKQNALKGIQRFFTVTDKSCLNRYLDYNEFEKLFYKNDMEITGEFYEKVKGITIETAVEGTVDKSNGLVKAGFQVGLGGIPFVEFEGYSDDTNLYAATALAEDKLMMINYKGDLYEAGSRIGLKPTTVNIFQKSYIEFFEFFISSQKNNRMQELLKHKQIKKDLLGIYGKMQVEKEDNLEGGVVYDITIPSMEVQTFLSDMCMEFPEFQSQGYADIVEKFISQQGILLQVVIPKHGDTSQISMKNPDNGYLMTLTREEQEKEGALGFCETITAVIAKEEKDILNASFVLDYSRENNGISVTFSETENQIEGSISGILTTDAKEREISLIMEELVLTYHDTTIDLQGNLQAAYGEFTVMLPELETVDIIHGSEQEIKELKNQIGKNIKGRVGGAIRQILKSFGISF